MTPERWRQVEEFYHAALELPAGQRSAFLTQTCGSDEELRNKVAALLKAHSDAGDFLVDPAMEVAAQAASKESASLIGRQISHYEILSLLGAGGMAEVYRARDIRLNRIVAVKVLPQQVPSDPELQSRFEREAQTIASLNHPHICTLYDVGRHDGIAYLVMEYLEGETLEQRLEQGPLPLDHVLKFAIEIADALDKAHRQGVTHRDLKPSNIMLTKSGAKLLDFGLAKLKKDTQSAGAASALATNPTLTAAGTILGTLQYMSPEQLEGKEADSRADIFAFGATVYEMVTGKKAFEGKSQAGLITKIMDRDPAPMSSLQPKTPPHLDHIVMRCLAKDADQRWQTASDIQHELKGLAEELANLGRIGSKPEIAAPPESAAAIDSLAVLPFANASGNPDTEYLSDGITESLINSLSQIPKLRVVPRSSAFRYKGSEIDAKKVGRQLKVRALLMGKVLQRGDTLNVQVELVDVKREAQLWGERFVRRVSDIFAVEDEIAGQITEKLRLRITGEERERLARRYTQDTEAYQLYLKGRFYWAKRTPDNVKKAMGLYQQALDRDPNYALAYVGIADCYTVLGLTAYATMPPAEAFPRAKAAAQKAIALDDSLAEAHAALSQCAFFYDWDWAGAERSIRRSLEIGGPNATLAQSHTLFLLAVLGRFEEAIGEARRFTEADPLSVNAAASLAFLLFSARRLDEAIKEARKAIEIDSTFAAAHAYLSFACQAKGQLAEAVQAAEKAASLIDRPVFKYGHTGWIYGLAGRRQDAIRTLDLLTEASRHTYVSPNVFAWIYCGLGDGENWAKMMQASLEERAGALVFLKTPIWDNMRTHPFFDELVHKMGLP